MKFCKNCKFYGGRHECDLDRTYKYDPVEGKVTDIKSVKCSERNKDFDCPHYISKWWKFWRYC